MKIIKTKEKKYPLILYYQDKKMYLRIEYITLYDEYKYYYFMTNKDNIEEIIKFIKDDNIAIKSIERVA